MRQLTFTAPGKLEWWDVQAPQLTGGADALVEPLVVARCDLDLYITRGMFPVTFPFAAGHETVGRVVEIGDDVQTVSPHDLVIFPFQVSCGSCAACMRGHTNACTSVPFRSSFGLAGLHGHEWGGGFSERLRVPFADHMLRRLPVGCDLEQVVGAADNVTDGYRAVQPALERFPGADVLIVGGLAQSCGLYAAMAARALTIGRVLYVDTSPARLAMAQKIGAETLATPNSDAVSLGEFPITVDASASEQGLLLAIRSTAPMGICTCLSGSIQPNQQIPRTEMFGRGISLEISRANVNPLLDRVLDDIANQRLSPAQVAEPALRFADAPAAMSDASPRLIFRRDDG